MRKVQWTRLAFVVVIVAGMALLAVKLGDDAVQDFRLERVSGGRFYLREHRGKCVVLVFWSTMCTPCKQEMAFLEELRRELADERLLVAGICIDAESPDQAQGVTEQLRIGYPILLDTGGKVAEAWRVKTVPTTVIVDPRGRVEWRREGYDEATERVIRSQIERMLATAGAAK